MIEEIIGFEMQEDLVRYNILAANRGSEVCMKPLISDKGRVFVSADCISGEPNFILNYSNDAFLYSILKGSGKAFIDGNGYFNSRSLYISTLSKTALFKDIINTSFVNEWNENEEAVKIKIKKPYKLAKIAALSILYGAGAGNPHKNTGLYNLFKLNNAGISFEETKAIWNGFWNSIPDVANFRDSMQTYFEKCKKDKKPALNAFGFIIPSSDPHKAFNYVIQSSLSAWIRELLSRLIKNNTIGVSDTSLAILTCVVHDELVVQVLEDKIEEYREALTKTLEETNNYFELKYPIELGFNVGTNFYEIH